ncbi:MAG: hypothetical protein KGQ57_18520, partial [Burkholderiales bacterium]|nr:hypothetical protein [Burkholderiales bacterium]
SGAREPLRREFVLSSSFSFPVFVAAPALLDRHLTDELLIGTNPISRDRALRVGERQPPTAHQTLQLVLEASICLAVLAAWPAAAATMLSFRRSRSANSWRVSFLQITRISRNRLFAPVRSTMPVIRNVIGRDSARWTFERDRPTENYVAARTNTVDRPLSVSDRARPPVAAALAPTAFELGVDLGDQSNRWASSILRSNLCFAEQDFDQKNR